MMRANFAKYAWGLLVYTQLVVLWGVVVRATSSGAGCGGHWPTCNGQFIPISPTLNTIIEFTHRLTSGLSVILILVLLVWAWRAYPKGHPVRLGAVLSTVFIFSEALVGAGLVLFQWVAQNVSVGRTISIAVHLVNTFLLLASIDLTAWWASGGERVSLAGQGKKFWALLAGMLGVIALGVSGAITALGDTLFPSSSLAAGISQDFSPNVNFLIHLRVYHPLIAALVGVYVLILSAWMARETRHAGIRRFAWILAGLFVLQLCAGLINLYLLAPVWMQLVHLLLADAVWLTLILLAASALVSMYQPADGRQPTADRRTAAVDGRL